MVKKLKIKENVSDAVDSLPYLKYRIKGNTVVITNCDKGLTELVIPSEINGYPVTELGNNCFLGCVNLKFVKIPTSVTTIGESAFEDCWRIRSIDLPNSVTMIGNRAFHGCGSLTSITIPNSVISIGAEAFETCWSLIAVRISNSVKSIGVAAFNSCPLIRELRLPRQFSDDIDIIFGDLDDDVNLYRGIK